MNSGLFDQQLEIKDELIDGEGPWWWARNDDGGWTGPRNDWLETHSIAFFKRVRKFDVVVTAGANQGMYARFHAKKFAQVYAFEPSPLSFHALCRNVQEPNVIKIQAALSDHNGTGLLRQFAKCNTGMHKVVTEESDCTIPILLLTVDSLKLPALDLLQLDVEGHEHHVLLGAMDTISLYRPVVIVENAASEPYHALFDSMNYKEAGNSVSDFIWVPKEF